MRVLFVCEGNTCRSPMLAAMFEDYLISFGISGIEVDSAGTQEHEGCISPYAATVLSAHGIAYDEKRQAKYCSKNVIEGSDCIIAMTEPIAQILREKYGFKRVAAMCDICGFDIPDPYGKGLEEYQKIYKLLFEALPIIYDFIK